MQVKHSFSDIPKSIFLAGPTPRSADVVSWRPEAISLLESFKFTGDVYVPEHPNWAAQGTYDKQVHWEWEAINVSTVVAFWVPRDVATMPAFTTNVEFGLLVTSGKVVFGCPEHSAKNRYLISLAERFNVAVHKTLQDTMLNAVIQASSIFGSRTI